MLSFFISSISSFVDVFSESSIFNDSMPIRLHALPFIFTYVAEAGLSPTKIVASIGVTPVFSLIFETLCFNSSSDFSDNFFPSSTIAIIMYDNIPQIFVNGV